MTAEAITTVSPGEIARMPTPAAQITINTKWLSCRHTSGQEGLLTRDRTPARSVTSNAKEAIK